MEKHKINLSISIDLIVGNDGEIEILDTKSVLGNKQELNINQWQSHSMSDGEVKYGYVKFSTKTNIGKILPLNENIKVILSDSDGNEIYKKTVKTHSSIKGRCDGLTSFFNVNSICGGKELLAKYLIDEKILEFRLK